MLRFVLTLLIAAAVSASLIAQRTITISGTVQDASGAPIPEVAVQLVVADGVVSSGTSGSEGRYAVQAPSGVPFRLIARRAGFSDEVVEFAGVDRGTTRDIRLQVGRIADTAVVTATRSPESQARLTQSVTVLTEQDIDAIGATSLADVIRFVPGAAVESSGREGATTALFTRGGESDYNLVLIDGVRVNMSGGAFDFSRVAAGEIERVEIVRGAQSALYGSDAMGAVVQVFTRRAAATDAPLVAGSLEGGSFKSFRGDVRVAGGAAGRVDYVAGVAARRTDGAFADLLPQDDKFEQTAFDAAVGAALGPRASVRTGVRYSNAQGASAGQIAYGLLNTGSAYDSKDLSWYLHFNHSAGTRYTGTATVNYFRANHVSSDTGTDAPVNAYALLEGTPGAIFPDGPRLVRLVTASGYATLLSSPLPSGQFLASTPFGVAFGDSAFTSRTQFRRPAFKYAGEFQWGGGHRLIAGYEWERETNALVDAQELTNNAAFVQQQFGFADRWFATVGFRVDDKSMYEAFFSPKLSAGGYLVPAGPGAVSSVKVFGNIGKGIKSPTFSERFGGSFADPSADLKVERARAMDLGVEVTLADQRVRATATVFNNHYRDLIEFVSTSPSFAPDGLPDFRNIAGSNSHGVELEGVLLRPYLGVTAAVTYAFVPTEVIETTDFDAQFRPGQPLLRRPKHSGTLRLNYNRGPVGVQWDTRVVGDRHDASFIGLFTPSFESGEITFNPGYTVSGLGVEYRLQRGLTLYFRGDNIFDAAYRGLAWLSGDAARGRRRYAGQHRAVGPCVLPRRLARMPTAVTVDSRPSKPISASGPAVHWQFAARTDGTWHLAERHRRDNPLPGGAPARPWPRYNRGTDDAADSLMPPGFVIESAFASGLPVFAFQPCTVTSAPVVSPTCGQPCASSASRLPNSTFQLITLPAASFTSMNRYTCGLVHSTLVTVPTSLTGWL